MTKDPVDRAIAEHHARVFAKHSVMSTSSSSLQISVEAICLAI
jgi:hypothetical protein